MLSSNNYCVPTLIYIIRRIITLPRYAYYNVKHIIISYIYHKYYAEKSNGSHVDEVVLSSRVAVTFFIVSGVICIKVNAERKVAVNLAGGYTFSWMLCIGGMLCMIRSKQPIYIKQINRINRISINLIGVRVTT